MPQPADPYDLRSSFVASGDELHDAIYPELYNLSAAFFFRFMPRPPEPAPPEFLYLPMPSRSAKNAADSRLAMIGVMSSWNFAWEAAQLRQEMLGHKFAEVLPRIQLQADANVYLLPETKHRLQALAPIYMLLPLQTLQKFGLPPLRKVTWPDSLLDDAEPLLPTDFGRRLAAAFASHVWPFMVSGSSQSAFRRNDSLVLLAHELDYWLPHVTSVVQARLGALDLVDVDDPDQGDDAPEVLARLRNDMPDGIWVDRCRTGGHVWLGAEEAADALRDVVRMAERDGRLSGIIEAIQSNRVQDDFSDRWSFAREDFERKLYSKRAKIKVSFVEFEQAEAVVSPRSDVTENLLWRDFLAVLDPKERRIVVCLARSATKLGEVAAELGYANHSPVSKALDRIRKKARKLIE